MEKGRVTLTEIKRVSENFKDYETFAIWVKGRNCKKECAVCSRLWKDIETKFIHAAFTTDLRYICTECLNDYKNETNKDN